MTKRSVIKMRKRVAPARRGKPDAPAQRRRSPARHRRRSIAPLYAVCGDFDLLLACHSCSEPDGHVYLLVHSEYRCVYCGLGELA